MNIYEKALELLGNKENFAFATIATDIGSTPRSKGSKMIIKSDGSIYGTIGGGSMEAICIKKAAEVIESKESIIYEFNLSNKDASRMDMICGGCGEILIDYIDFDNKNNEKVFLEALKCSNSNKKGWTAVVLKENEGRNNRHILFVSHNKEIIGEFSKNEDMKNKLISELEGKYLSKNEIDGVRFVIDSVYSGGKAYIFGAGHVSKDVATILNLLEFDTVVIDDRKEFANEERFPNSEIIVLNSLESIPELPIDDDSYILIITRGHMHDSNVLEWALKTEAYYIGMIGSKRKVQLTYDKLIGKGFTDEQLERVHAPIGIKLKAQTPAEIAVSIGAQLINCRSDKENK